MLRLFALVASAGLPLALAGCVDLDALRARAGGPDAGEGDGCQGDPEDVRLWTLHIGQRDYVTLKNLGRCSVELGGLHLFVDDHSEMFPDGEVDCLVQLPAHALPAGAEVRVHEEDDGPDGDIAALPNALSGCTEGVPPNPERGAVVYLCRGPCDVDTVIDAVAFTGERFGPPEPRFRQSFDAPLAGVLIATQDTARFRRVATDGEAPSFLASDWALETRYLHADFDQSVDLELDGETVRFGPEPGQSATVRTTTHDPMLAASLSIEQGGSAGRSEGLGVALTFAQGRPRYLSYRVRMQTLPASGGYLDLRTGDLSALRAGFEGDELGTDTRDGGRAAVLAAAGVFYQVELRNLDWDVREYDLYVDRVMVARRVQLVSNVNAASRLSLYGESRDSSAAYDEIEAWR